MGRSGELRWSWKRLNYFFKIIGKTSSQLLFCRVNGHSGGHLGALIYFMLQAEMPFGSWRESELTFARIVKGLLTLPQNFSTQAADLITKLLEVEESARLGMNSIKAHPWFDGIDWNGLAQGKVPVPYDIVSRINLYVESHHDDVVISSTAYTPDREWEELNTPEWLQDW